jgi:hypothetical protein
MWNGKMCGTNKLTPKNSKPFLSSKEDLAFAATKNRGDSKNIQLLRLEQKPQNFMINFAQSFIHFSTKHTAKIKLNGDRMDFHKVMRSSPAKLGLVVSDWGERRPKHETN